MGLIQTFEERCAHWAFTWRHFIRGTRTKSGIQLSLITCSGVADSCSVRGTKLTAVPTVYRLSPWTIDEKCPKYCLILGMKLGISKLCITSRLHLENWCRV